MKDLTGYIGKKVDIRSENKVFSGYFFEIIEAEDSGIGKDCIDLCLLDGSYVVEIGLDEIDEITIDDRYIVFTV